MNPIVRRGLVVGLLVLSVACGSSEPTSPSPSNQPPSSSPPTPTPTPRPTPILRHWLDFPPVAGPSRTFTFTRQLLYPVSGYTQQSRFVLFDNGAVVLQYPPIGRSDGAYRGQYQEDANGTLWFLFQFQGRKADEPADAMGTLNGDSLTIEYDEIMQHSDFENAVYQLVR